MHQSVHDTRAGGLRWALASRCDNMHWAVPCAQMADKLAISLTDVQAAAERIRCVAFDDLHVCRILPIRQGGEVCVPWYVALMLAWRPLVTWHCSRPHAHVTPVMTCSALSEMAGCELHFKCEIFQRTGRNSVWHPMVATGGGQHMWGPPACQTTACALSIKHKAGSRVDQCVSTYPAHWQAPSPALAVQPATPNWDRSHTVFRLCRCIQIQGRRQCGVQLE